MYFDIPTERPLQFKQVPSSYNKEPMWVVVKEDSSPGGLDNVTKTAITHACYSLQQLKELFKIAEEQKEPADLMSWIQHCINDTKRFVFVLIEENGKGVWAVQTERPATENSVFSYVDRTAISKLNFTLEELAGMRANAIWQGESEEVKEAIKQALFDNSLGSFEYVPLPTGGGSVWMYCWALEVEDREYVAIRKSAITAKIFTKEQVRDFHVKAVCQNQPESLIQHIEKTLTYFHEETA